MSVFNRVLASIGIGSAVVDTIIEEKEFVPGSEIKGVVTIRGGNVEQEVDSIYLSLKTFIIVTHDDKKVRRDVELKQIRLTDSVLILPDETKELPFSIHIPYCTPISLQSNLVWLQTVLDIKNAIDPKDTDYIQVKPNKLMSSLLDTVQSLGFRNREVTTEKAPRFLQYITPIVQEFELVPTSGIFRGKLDELEVILIPENDEKLLVYFEIDRKARGFSGIFYEMMETDESHVKFHITTKDLPNLKEQVQSIISRYA